MVSPGDRVCFLLVIMLLMPITLFYLAVVAFALGIIFVILGEWTLPTIFWFGLMALAFTLVVLRDRGQSVLFVFLAVVFCFSFLGGLRTDFVLDNFKISALDQWLDEKVTLSGEVVREPDRRNKVTYLTVLAEETLVLVGAPSAILVDYGDVITFSGKLTLPEDFETDLGRTFAYQNYLQAKGIKYRVDFAKVTIDEKDQGNYLLEKLFTFKGKFVDNLSTYISEPAFGLGVGLLLGVKRALDEELETAFRKTGIIHIVVLSGYNVMLVVLFVMFILGYFLKPNWRLGFGLLAIVTFALLVGLSATVLRASIMAGILLIAEVTKRRYLALRGLFVAGFIMLVFNPLLVLYDVGFQLSFLATFGLITLSPLLEQVFKFVPNWLNARSFLVATLSTTIVVLPLLLYQIGELSLVAVLVNLLVLPMVPLAMLLVALVGFTAFISGSMATVLSVPAYYSLTYINNTALFFASFPLASVTIPVFAFFLVPLCYLVIFAFFFWLKRKLKSNSVDATKAEDTPVFFRE